MIVSKFYDLFPKIKYDINNSKLSPKYDEVTDIFRRIAVVRETISNISSYEVYEIEDGDTPEILAEKFYRDPGGAWLILMANNILDPQFEWPLDYQSFTNYIIEKYGSVETALTTPHHYEKVITRRNTRTGFESVTRFIVNEERLTDNMPDDIPFSYYEPWVIAESGTLDRGNLAITGEFTPPQVYTINGEPIEIIIKGEKVFCFEHEQRLNEEKRLIKVIKSEYYDRIQNELQVLMSPLPASYVRRLV